MNGVKQENKRWQLYFDSGLPIFSGHTKIALSNKMLSFPLDWQVKVSEKLPQPPAWSSSLARCTQPEKIALPFCNSSILFTFWTSNTVLGSLSAIGIWKIVWFFQKIKFNKPGKVRRVCLDRTFHQQDFPEPTRASQIPDLGIILNLKNTLPLMMTATFNNCVSVSWSPWCMSLRYWLSCKASAGTAVTALFNTSATSRRSWKYDCCQWKLHPVCSCRKPDWSADRVKAIQRHYDADLAESLDAKNLCVRDLLVHSIS